MLQVNWHDFAFFDPVMYESLRQLIRHSQTEEAEAVFAAMDLAFAIDLCKEEGAGQVMATFPFCVCIRVQCLHMSECFSVGSAGGAPGRWGQHACDSSERVRVREEIRRAQDAGGGRATSACECT